MTRQGHSGGLVLSELILAIFITGLLAVGVAVQLGGATATNAKALALYNMTQKMAADWGQVASTCGVKSDVIGSPLLIPGSMAADVYTKGGNAINANFQACYYQSQVHLLTDAIQVTSSGPQLQQYAFTLSGGGLQPFIAQFTNVPAELTYALATRYGNLKGPALLAQNLSDPHVRYWPNNQNDYTVQLLVGQGTQLAAASGTIIGTTAGGSAASSPPSTGSPPPPGPTAPTTLSPPPATAPQSLPAGAGAGSGSGSGSGSGAGSGSDSGSGAGSGSGSGAGSGSGSSSGSGSGSGSGAGSGSFGYPPLPNQPQKPQDVNLSCSGGWSQSQPFYDSNGNATVYYVGYTAKSVSSPQISVDLSSVSATGGSVNAKVQGSTAGGSPFLELCMAQRTYILNSATHTWNADASWATADYTASVSNGQMCGSGSTTTGSRSAGASSGPC